MNSRNFETLLLELDPVEMRLHSVRNHHVNGLDYLCLHRSDKMTVKLYFIDPETIPRTPGEFLVTPHTHRYAFESTVLSGCIYHLRFEECEGNYWHRSRYVPEIRACEFESDTGLRVVDKEIHEVGSEYWVDVSEIHTLIASSRPTLLGLVQYSDTRSTSQVYVAKEKEMIYPASRKPTIEETRALRDIALAMIKTSR
ncbi:hypothetical protein ACFSHT_22335 [Paraburkholderia silviterrae]|uniref:Uncharacterized protein n=1 Tax=Paraburkholderia silviterrae TaxID=2528715 RepID=A0A4R5MF49_9BURK|nr:hypothetical protein [Paraburkholderia silviterrae]TDG25879.1 hypothetical protein EYW47_00470 [Paraburkholderia silviterrae]